MPFFLDDKRETKLTVNKEIKISVPDRSGIFIYFRPRDLGFPRITELRLLLLPEEKLKENDIPWEKN
jgi:hypothetical protein